MSYAGTAVSDNVEEVDICMDIQFLQSNSCRRIGHKQAAERVPKEQLPTDRRHQQQCA